MYHRRLPGEQLVDSEIRTGYQARLRSCSGKPTIISWVQVLKGIHHCNDNPVNPLNSPTFDHQGTEEILSV